MLRRLVCVLLSASLLFIFSSCSAGTEKAEEPITSHFECDMDVQYRDMNVKGHLTRRTAGTLLLEITEPSTLNGLSMEWNGETILLKLHGLSFDVSPSALRKLRWEKAFSARWIRQSAHRRTARKRQKGSRPKGARRRGRLPWFPIPKRGICGL